MGGRAAMVSSIANKREMQLGSERQVMNGSAGYYGRAGTLPDPECEHKGL